MFEREARMTLKNRLFGLNEFKLMGSDDVGELIAALELKKALFQDTRQLNQARKVAAIRLGLLKDPRAVDSLVAALQEKSLAEAAASALGDIGDHRAVDPLTAALYKGDWQMRRSAANALGEIGGGGARESLITALKDPEEQVRQAAARALGKIGGAQAVEALLAALKDGEMRVRAAAAEALGVIGDVRALKPLIAALDDRNPGVSEAAANALGRIGAPAVEPLLTAFLGENLFVRNAADSALSRAGWWPGKDAKSAAYLAAKGNWDALVAIGEPAVEPLIGALQDQKHQDARGRQSAAMALGMIGDPRAVEPLLAALLKEDVRETAAEALERIGWKPGEDEDAAAYWLAKGDWEKCTANGASAVKALAAALLDSQPANRLRAVKAIVQVGGAPTVKPLITALKDADRDVRRSAAGALVALYKSGTLNAGDRALIFAQKSAITMHEDRYEDTGRSSDCTSYHVDYGTGVAFPDA